MIADEALDGGDMALWSLGNDCLRYGNLYGHIGELCALIERQHLDLVAAHYSKVVRL
jgi:hypothetical protein